MAKTIRFFSRGKYNHTSLIFGDDECIEAHPLKGVYYHQKYYDDIEGKRYVIEIYDVVQTDKQSRMMEYFAHRQVGKKYDFFAFFGFLFYASKENRKSRNRWMCSELTLATFQHVGINLLDRVEAWKISPTILSYTPKLKLVKTVIVTNGKIVKEIFPIEDAAVSIA